MKKLVTGILAHVDAGKTTLSEGILYTTGTIRSMGRVDNKDAHLDTFELEKERGITIFSKQAVFTSGDTEVTLLDTPGHIDFSAEMERTLQVLDYAILVISGADGVQGHTETLWRLLKKNQIPTFLFINKMDQPGTDKEKLLSNLHERLGDGFVDFNHTDLDEFYENIALHEERVLDDFLSEGIVSDDTIRELIKTRKIFPCYFGSALKMDGVDHLVEGLIKYSSMPVYPSDFGAKIFKIARDEQGNRLTYMKITGGCLKVRDVLSNRPLSSNTGESLDAASISMLEQNESWEEKVNQIRIYSGVKFTTPNEVMPGTICSVTGLTKTYPGEGLGFEKESGQPMIEPVLTYQIILPENCPASVALPKLRQIEEEEPLLHILWDEHHKEIQIQIMGEVQTEILKRIVKERFDMDIGFGTGAIVYKETIRNTVEGVGHFEPLRHYAEVHLLLEPLEMGSGLVLSSDCSEDMLDRNWQRLILTHLMEKPHRGVLTGSYITDMKITLVAGRAHLKHTEGGDFRQATYRAVRQGLKQAESVLLEPYYEFHLEVPETMVGRAMADVERMCGTFEAPVLEEGIGILEGIAPVSTMQEYPKEVIAYTRGQGRIYCSLHGYLPCHNAGEVMEEIRYDSERDLDNPTGSVFCAHGAGFPVSWDQVPKYMHLESILSKGVKQKNGMQNENDGGSILEDWIGVDEIDRILARTFYANKKDEGTKKWGKKTVKYASSMTLHSSSDYRAARKEDPKKEYLLVDGYNIIFAWDELRELAEDNVDGARGKLQDILCNYQAFKKCDLILVFDAYRVQGHQTEIMEYHNIHVVFTKEAETADQYIEKFAHENGRKYQVTVATADGLEQVIIRGQGCALLSARELKEEVKRVNELIRTEYMEKEEKLRNYLLNAMTEEERQKLEGNEESGNP